MAKVKLKCYCVRVKPIQYNIYAIQIHQIYNSMPSKQPKNVIIFQLDIKLLFLVQGDKAMLELNTAERKDKNKNKIIYYTFLS